MRKKNSPEQIEYYNQFIDRLQERAEATCRLVGVSNTFTFEEIDKVSNFYDNHFRKASKLGLAYEEFAEMYKSYMGAAFLFHKGGRWIIDDDKRTDTYGEPIIIDWENGDLGWARISVDTWRYRVEEYGKEEGVGPSSTMFR